VLGDDEPLLISGRVNRPFRTYFGWGLVAGGLLVSAVLVSLLGPPWNWGTTDSRVLVVLIPPVVLSLGGLILLRLGSEKPAASFALTPRAIWRRAIPGHWEPLVSLSDVRRVEAGSDDVRFALFMNAGATLEVVDDQHRTFSVGPVDNPMRWVELIAALCAERGVTIESYVHPWVVKYNPPSV